MFLRRDPEMPSADNALPGRSTPIATSTVHAVSGRNIHPPFPEGYQVAYFGMGCFWGAERKFWQDPGVYVTAAGYQGGFTPNPTYEEVCSGRTGHTESVLVVYPPSTSFGSLLQLFWESHDPTQGMRQGNDRGTQYRSAIYCSTAEQPAQAEASAASFGERLSGARYGPITTEVAMAAPFFYAEEYHQQYLHKVPNGYCGLSGTGVSCPVGLETS